MRRAVLALVVAAGCADPAPPPDCAPTGGGPYQLIEQETVTVPLTCATEGETRTGDLLAIADLPAGAVYDPLTATMTWTPGLDQAAVYDLTLSAGEELTTGTVHIAVADAFDTPGNVPPVDPDRYPEELGLPVIFISPAPTSQEYQPITITMNGETWGGWAKLRGATSLNYPKNSYTVKLGGSKFVLTSTFDDDTYVRQRLAFQLWDDMDEDHVPIAAASAVVYLDGEFWGLYAKTDHVDLDRFGEAGNLYKAINHDANFRYDRYDASPKATLHDGYLKKDGFPVDDFSDLDELVDFVASADATTFAAEIGDRVDLRDIEDWYVLVTYILASDSGGKNSYLFHPADGGRWRYAPWDFNHSFGQDWQTLRTASDDFDDFRGMNQLFVRLLDDPTLGAALAARYAALLAGPLADDAVLARFDAMVAETAAVARRDWRKWGEAYRTYPGWNWRTDFLDYESEVDYTRQWLIERGPFIRSLLGP